MSGLTWHQVSDGGRMVAYAGLVAIGHIQSSGDWYVHLPESRPRYYGYAPTPEAARAALEAAWADWMRDAGLTWRDG